MIELAVVVAIIGLISGVAATRFGHGALNTTEAEGFVRRLMLDMRQARRRAITTGVDHYVQLSRTSGVVTSFAVYESGVGQADDTRDVPTDVAVTASNDTWTFDFDGALTSSGSSSTITVDGVHYQWVLTCYHATGHIQATKAAQP